MNISDHMIVPDHRDPPRTLEPDLLPILNTGVNVYESFISLLYEVIEADSKPVKVRLDFDEEDLPFYCNLLTWPESLPKPWPGTSPEKPSEKLKQINVKKKQQQPCLLQSQDF